VNNARRGGLPKFFLEEFRKFFEIGADVKLKEEEKISNLVRNQNQSNRI
jgi:hypothetical protein